MNPGTRAILSRLDNLERTILHMATQLDLDVTALQLAVTNEASVEQSAITLLNGLPGLVATALANAGVDEATSDTAVQAVTQMVNQNSANLAVAINANNPNATVPANAVPVRDAAGRVVPPNPVIGTTVTGGVVTSGTVAAGSPAVDTAATSGFGQVNTPVGPNAPLNPAPLVGDGNAPAPGTLGGPVTPVDNAAGTVGNIGTLGTDRETVTSDGTVFRGA